MRTMRCAAAAPIRSTIRGRRIGVNGPPVSIRPSAATGRIMSVLYQGRRIRLGTKWAKARPEGKFAVNVLLGRLPGGRNTVASRLVSLDDETVARNPYRDLPASDRRHSLLDQPSRPR